MSGSDRAELLGFLKPAPAPEEEDVLANREEIEKPVDRSRFKTLRRLATDESHRLFVSFGGGALAGLCGNLALAQILEELGLREHVDEIWGTSAGAVVGGGWASGASAQQILERVRSLDRRGVLDVHWLRFALAILATIRPFRRPAPDGFIHGEAFWSTIEGGLPVKTFEECPTPFRCIACNADGLGRKVFRRGELMPAIFSSMSLPGIMIPRPMPDDGRIYYDGGLLEKSPLFSPLSSHLTSGDQRKLVLLCTHFGNEASVGETRGFHNRFLATMYALESLAWDYQLKEARERKNLVLSLLNPRLGVTSLFDFSQTDKIYLTARLRLTDLLQNAKIASTLGMT